MKMHFVQTAQGVNGAPSIPKLYASCGIDISKCIEGRSINLATQVEFFKHIIFLDLDKAKPLREQEELPI